jgi:hypothetical protein
VGDRDVDIAGLTVSAQAGRRRFLINWPHILLAFICSAVVASLTDWYFFGVLFHDRYAKTPAVWRRYRDKSDEYRSIVISQAVLAVSSLVFILVCSGLGLVSARSALLAAVTVWVMIPVPLLATNAIFIPMDRSIVVSHSLGWLARLLVTALFVWWFL